MTTQNTLTIEMENRKEGGVHFHEAHIVDGEYIIHTVVEKTRGEAKAGAQQWIASNQQAYEQWLATQNVRGA